MMKKMIACLLTLALALTAVCALAEGSLTFSWWGGDARHEANQQAVEAFKAATGIDVQCTYSAWSGWEDKMSQYFASDSAFDVNQINWNWLYSFTNADGRASSTISIRSRTSSICPSSTRRRLPSAPSTASFWPSRWR